MISDGKQMSSWQLQSFKAKKLAHGGEEKQLASGRVQWIRDDEFGLGPGDLQVRRPVWM